MTLAEIKKRKQVGNIQLASRMLDMQPGTISMILKRESHGEHKKVVDCLELILLSEEEMVKNYKFENSEPV
jgi:hypothetical protein